MKNCFEGLIGLRELDANCVYWVNDMIGIDTQLAEHLQTYDNENLRQFLEMIKTRCFTKFLANFTIAFHSYYASCCKERNEIETFMQDLICTNKTLLIMPFLNSVCLEFILEKIHSRNINYFTTTNIETAKELATHYATELDKTFTNAMKSIFIPETMKVEKTGFCALQTSYILP